MELDKTEIYVELIYYVECTVQAEISFQLNEPKFMEMHLALSSENPYNDVGKIS